LCSNEWRFDIHAHSNAGDDLEDDELRQALTNLNVNEKTGTKT